MTREEFVVLASRCQKPLRRFLTALCVGDAAAASDLAQDTLVKAYLSCDSLQDESKFQAWVFRIASNTFLNSRRSFRYIEPLEEANVAVESSRADDAFRYQHLYKALESLPPAQRTAITLFYLQDYSSKEISEAMGISDTAVRQHLSRGRKQLHNLLSSTD